MIEAMKTPMFPFLFHYFLTIQVRLLRLLSEFNNTGFLANVYFRIIFEAYLCHFFGDESCRFWPGFFLNQITLRGGVSVSLVLARHGLSLKPVRTL